MVDSVKESNGILTGVKAFDEDMHGVLMGNMFGIAGDSGQMKTMFSLWLQISILMTNPTMTAAYFEKEMPVKDIARRLVSMYIKQDMSAIMDIAAMGEEEKLKAEQDIEQRIKEEMTKDNKYTDALHRLHLIPSDKFSDALDIWEIVEGLNINVWALDFVTMLGSDSDSDDTYHFVSRQLSILKDMTTSTNTLGIPLSQLKQNTVDTRQNKIPKLSDMEYGSKLKQYAAYLFAVFYPSYYYRGWSSDYFFAVGLKTRHNKPLTVPFITNPSLCYYSEPTKLQKDDMMSKLINYRNPPKT